MKNIQAYVEIVQLVKEYMEEEGKTYIFSQGKMLSDEEMPDDIREMLKSA